MGVILVVVLGVILVGGVGLIAYYARKRRIQEWQQTAAHLGFQFSTEDPFDLLNLPFALFRRGDGRGTENVVWGQKNGVEIKAFEFWDYTESSDTKGGRSRSYEHFSCSLLPVDAYCPHTTIAPEGFFSRMGRALGFHDIEFESEDFNRAWKVESANPKFANYLVDARMMQWLLENKGWRFELSDRWMLTYRGRVRPREIWNVIEAAREFHMKVPKVIGETYGEGS
jgi:hypothetical protein